MKFLLTSLLTVLLIPISANAAETQTKVSYFAEVCQKAYPQDSKAAVECMLKSAGFDPDAPSPTPEELYGELDDPKRVEEILGHWEKELLANQQSFLACKGQLNFNKCALKAMDEQLAIHEHLFESLKPPAWPSSASTRYALTHAMSAALRESIACEPLISAEKATCLKKMADDGNRKYSEGWNALFKKAEEQMERQQAARERKVRSHDQQLRVEEIRSQREHELELARIQALGMFLGSGGFRSFQPMPTYQPPPPTQIAPGAPLYPLQDPRRPLNCTSNMVGNQVYTNCY